jgi:hypothetical protein
MLYIETLFETRASKSTQAASAKRLFNACMKVIPQLLALIRSASR